jgi:hypothetical protein
MNQNILHVGLDVDDTQYHGSAFNSTTARPSITRKYKPPFCGVRQVLMAMS